MIICILFYVLMIYKGCEKLDNLHKATLMLFCIGAFSFYTYAVNGVRNGIACSFAIIALSCLCKGEKIWSAFFSIIAIGCHKSAALPVAAMLFTYFVRGPKCMFFSWLCAIAISIAVGDYVDNMLSLMNYDERLANNLQDDIVDGVIMEHRFRWDFLIYSSMPILLGWYTEPYCLSLLVPLSYCIGISFIKFSCI